MSSRLAALFLAGCLLAASAVADDAVLLFTPGPPIAANDPVRAEFQYIENFRQAHPIVLNEAAFGAPVVRAEFNGKVHTFVMHRVPMGDSSPLTVWSGEEDDDSFSLPPDLNLRRGPKGYLSGDMFVPPRTFLNFHSASQATALVEMQAEVGVYRGPAWVMWVRLAGILAVLGWFVAFGSVYVWRKVRPRLGVVAATRPSPAR